jgi:3-hydroxybutyryl-CoA dehydrogenase
MNKAAVIGAGTMGNGIAHTFAMHGTKVVLIDVSQTALDKAIATITKNLERMVAKGKISEEDKKNTLANITTHTAIDKLIADVDLVVEAASEQFHIKTEVFKKLDEVCQPSTILASNTSSISITRIAAQTK